MVLLESDMGLLLFEVMVGTNTTTQDAGDAQSISKAFTDQISECYFLLDAFLPR